MANELWPAGQEELCNTDDAPQPTAALIRPEDLCSPENLWAIWRNVRQAYYVSPSWRPDFYVSLAYCGFISVSQAVPARTGSETIPLLIPEIQRTYGVLRFADLHIERNVRKRAAHYELRFDTVFEEVLSALLAYHAENCWLLPEYCDLLRALHCRGPVDILLSETGAKLEVHSIELFDRETGELVAGEVGYAIGTVFTSLTGFTRAGHPSAGKVQLIGLACVLQKSGFSFWNLGHPPREATESSPASMIYKREIGVSVVPRREFLRIWIDARDRPLVRLPPPCSASADEGTPQRQTPATHKPATPQKPAPITTPAPQAEAAHTTKDEAIPAIQGTQEGAGSHVRMMSLGGAVQADGGASMGIAGSTGAGDRGAGDGGAAGDGPRSARGLDVQALIRGFLAT